MIAVVHMGLHKTGSTLVQYLAALNAKSLLKNGVYFKPNLGYPAHHEEAARALRNDYGAIGRMATGAARIGAHTVFLSSENFESILFAPAVGLHIIETLKSAGCSQIVFALYVREQAETFWSLYSELSRHIRLDALDMFRSVMSKGYYRVAAAQGAEARRRQWCFSFDHARIVPEFQRSIAFEHQADVRFRVYDFNRAQRYPGDALFDDMGVGALITQFPPAPAVNSRLSDPLVKAKYRRKFAGAIPGLSSNGLPHFLTLDDEAEWRRRQRISQLLQQRFHGANLRLVEQFGSQPANLNGCPAPDSDVLPAPGKIATRPL